MRPSAVEIAPGLFRMERVETGAVVWIATANSITLLSYSEAYAREWLERESDDGPEAA